MYTPEVYNIIYNKLKEKHNPFGGHICYTQICKVINRIIKTNKKTKGTIVDELCYYGLLERCTRKKYKLLNVEVNSEKIYFDWLEQ